MVCDWIEVVRYNIKSSDENQRAMDLNPQFYHLLSGCGGHENVLCRPLTTWSLIDQGP